MNEPTNPASPDFQAFSKIARLSREVVVTEKIDGTNAQIFIDGSGQILAGSRNRWLFPGTEDNFGFRAWVEANTVELLKLGPGRHFGEWWGAGIQRRYGQTVKRFSLFNAGRWAGHVAGGGVVDIAELSDGPVCCGVVPVLYRGPFCTNAIEETLINLRRVGSFAAPGFMDPEGIVIYHTAGGQLFTKTCKDDEKRKSEVAQ